MCTCDKTAYLLAVDPADGQRYKEQHIGEVRQATVITPRKFSQLMGAEVEHLYATPRARQDVDYLDALQRFREMDHRDLPEAPKVVI